MVIYFAMAIMVYTANLPASLYNASQAARLSKSTASALAALTSKSAEGIRFSTFLGIHPSTVMQFLTGGST